MPEVFLNAAGKRCILTKSIKGRLVNLQIDEYPGDPWIKKHFLSNKHLLKNPQYPIPDNLCFKIWEELVYERYTLLTP